MSTRTPEREPSYGRARNANEAFKGRWNIHLGWSTMAAAGVHALFLLWSPGWDLDGSAGSSSNDDGIELIALDDGSASAGGVLPAAIVVGDEPSPAIEEADPGVGAGESDWDAAGSAAALREELRRRTSHAPTLAEPEIDQESDAAATAADSEAADGQSTRIGGGYSLSDYEGLTEDELLALERLSALRPELSFLSPSSWILLRNPSEVDAFLSERFGRPALGSGGHGSVSVAIWVDERGSVEWAEINRSSGRRDLDESALELFRKVVSFRPAREGGVPVPVAMIFWLTYPW